ncbi:MAG: GNAT family N-acetyltransferase [Candidatus Staskawiczbacteria bacterium]
MNENGPKFNPDGLEEQSEDEKSGIRVEQIDKLDEETLQQILEVEKESFSGGMQDLEGLRNILENKDGIHLCIRGEDNKISGYISSLRQTQEYSDLKNWDSDFENKNDNLYIDSIAVKPQNRNLESFNALIKTLASKAVEGKYKKIAMHARTSNNFSSILQKRYGAKFIRRLENWYNFGEPFDYLEIELPEE